MSAARESLDDPTIVVPVDASDPDELSPALVELLHPHEVILLGYYPVPDQASPEQLQAEFESEATAAMSEIAGEFGARGGTVTSLVVFTRDRKKTIERVSAEYDADAILTGGSPGQLLERVLVPLKGDINIERIVAFVGDLLTDNGAAVTLYHVATSDADETQGEFLLRGASDRLEDDGLDADRITWEQTRSESPARAITEAATGYDLVVVGESEPNLRERILGAITSEVITESDHPILVVRKK